MATVNDVILYLRQHKPNFHVYMVGNLIGYCNSADWRSPAQTYGTDGKRFQTWRDVLAHLQQEDKQEAPIETTQS